MKEIIIGGNDQVLMQMLGDYYGNECLNVNSVDELVKKCRRNEDEKVLLILDDISGDINKFLQDRRWIAQNSILSCFLFIDNFSKSEINLDVDGIIYLSKNSISSNQLPSLLNKSERNGLPGKSQIVSTISEFGEFFPDAFCLVNEDLEILYCNSEFFQNFPGYSEVLTGKRFLDIFSEDVVKKFHDNIKGIVSEDVHFEIKITPRNSIDEKRNYIVSMKLIVSESLKSIAVYFQDVTEYLNAQEQLLMFNRIIEQMPSSVMITDKSGRIEYVNEKFLRVTGYSFSEAVGNTPTMLKSNQHGEIFYSSMWNTILAGKVWKGEITNRKKDGKLFLEAATIIPLRDRKGNVTHFVAIKDDITEYKEMEHELEETEIKFRTVFSSIKEGIAILSESGEIIQVNESFVRLVGETDENKVTGKLLIDFVKEQDRQMVENYCSRVSKTGENITFDYQSMCGSDTGRDFEMSVASLKDQKGISAGYTILIKDISERKRSEQQLKMSEQRHRALVEAVPDLMFRLSDEGVFIDDIFRKKISKVFPEKMNSEMIEIMAKAFETNEIQTYEYPITINDSTKYYEARFIVSGVSEVLVIVRNVTDRHRAEEEYKKARDEAETANRAKSEFLANMSHEIRTPLNGIMGFIEILKKTKLERKQYEYLDIVSMSAKSLLGIINDILDFSKIESRKLEIDMVAFDPLKEFESVIDLFYVRAVEKNIELLSFIDPNLPGEIIGDPLRIKQVLANLLSNALKFTPENGIVSVTIEKEGLINQACEVLFSVTDTGIGIPEYKKKKIFEAFEQMDPSVTRRFGGTGLGLTIALNLVKLMGGALEVESSKGEGSNFNFLLEFGVGGWKGEDEVAELFETQPEVVIYRRDLSSELEDQLLRYLIAFKFLVTEVNDLDEFNTGKKFDAAFFVYHKENWYDVVAFIKANPEYPVIIISDAEGMARLDELKTKRTKIVLPPLNPSKILNALKETVNGAIIEFDEISVSRETEKRVLKAHVMVAEDNPVNQMLMRIMLNEYGIDAVIVANGIEAYDCYLKDKFDLIFMDINMPVADGVEATEMIRFYESENNIEPVPIIALTAKAMKGDQEELLAKGMNGYIPKPIEESIFKEILYKFLSGAVVKSSKAVETSRDKKYDKLEVAKQLGIPPDTMDPLINSFLENSHTVIENLDNAIRHKNREDVEVFSHKLKGASSNFRFDKLSELCRQVEETAQTESFENIEVLVKKIDSAYREILKMFLDE